jgi:hypothetical protein
MIKYNLSLFLLLKDSGPSKKNPVYINDMTIFLFFCVDTVITAEAIFIIVRNQGKVRLLRSSLVRMRSCLVADEI